MADPASDYSVERQTFVHRVGNGDPGINGVFRILMAALMVVCTMLLGTGAFLGESIYNEVHAEGIASATQGAQITSLTDHMANIDVNVARLQQGYDDISNRLSRLEGYDGKK